MKLADPVEQVCRGSMRCGRLRCVYEFQCKFALDTITLRLDVVLLIYDAFITFDREVACFWTAKRTGGSLLFFANKWISVSVYVMGLVELASFHSDKVSGLSPWYENSHQDQRFVYSPARAHVTAAR